MSVFPYHRRSPYLLFSAYYFSIENNVSIIEVMNDDVICDGIRHLKIRRTHARSYRQDSQDDILAGQLTALAALTH